VDSRIIADLVFHLGRIASGEGLAEGLTPAQWAVLRYFARANRFSRTPSAFAAFHGTTRGTASQMIKNLEIQGYLTRMRSDADGRSTRLDLTDKARDILSNDPFEALVRAANALPQGGLEGDGCCQEGRAPYACGFVSEPLLLKELDEICINFGLGKPAALKGSVTRAASR
jgi:DNA-binding MarR family transcriptional regulator